MFKFIIETDDPTEAKMLAHANDMAGAIWQFKANGFRQFKDTDYDYQPAWDAFNEILQEYGIDIDDLYR